MRRLFFVLTLLLAATLVACSGDAAREAAIAPLPDAAGGVYLALGDSVAAGSGASEPEGSSYVALVANALEERYGELELVSLAAGGHTTQDLIDQQLPAALERLAQGDVRLVTITISGNDLAQYAADEACAGNPSLPECPLEDGLLDVEQRLSTILGELQAAGPETTIVIQLYPNLFSGTGHPLTRQADIAFGLLNGVIASVAERHDVPVADPRVAFRAEGNRLTHLLDPTPDAHPNDDGHRAIALAFLRVLGLAD